MGPSVLQQTWNRAGHFGPFMAATAEKRKQMITLDLNHFGFCGRGGQRGGIDGRGGSKGEAKGGYSRSRANLNGVSWIAKTPRGTHKG